MKKKLIFFVFALNTIITKAQTINLNPTEFIVNSTVKIETDKNTGTGFFFRFKFDNDNVDVIVTNKHVVETSEIGKIYFKLADNISGINYKEFEIVTLKSFKSRWIYHPDTSIDLAILPVGPISVKYEKSIKKLVVVPYTENDIPDDSVKNSLTAIEDILMVGYPFGLRDNINDLPVVRKGITATPYFLDYLAKKEFLCDISVFPGSSGSPVIIYNPSSYTIKQGGTIFGTRLKLLGINVASYNKAFEGSIGPDSSGKTLVSKTSIPFNIAVVIKAERLLDFRAVIQKLL